LFGLITSFVIFGNDRKSQTLFFAITCAGHALEIEQKLRKSNFHDLCLGWRFNTPIIMIYLEVLLKPFLWSGVNQSLP